MFSFWLWSEIQHDMLHAPECHVGTSTDVLRIALDALKCDGWLLHPATFICNVISRHVMFCKYVYDTYWYIMYVICMLCVCNMMSTLQRREISRKTKSPTSSERTLRRGHGRRAQPWTCSAAVNGRNARNRGSEERPERHWSHNGLTKGIDRSLTCRRLVTRRGWDHKHNAESDPSTILVYVGEFDHFWSWLQMTSHGLWKRLNALPHSPWPFQVCHLCPIVTIVATGNWE